MVCGNRKKQEEDNKIPIPTPATFSLFSYSIVYYYLLFLYREKMSVDNNYNNVKKGFSKIATDFDGIVADELDRIASLMQERASMDAPVDTGYLASHIEKEVTGKNTVTVVATAEYSGYVDQGTSKMAANPFFSRNVEIIQTQEIPNIEKNIGVKIEADFAVVR